MSAIAITGLGIGERDDSAATNDSNDEGSSRFGNGTIRTSVIVGARLMTGVRGCGCRMTVLLLT
jgi:hypothetical protein